EAAEAVANGAASLDNKEEGKERVGEMMVDGKDTENGKFKEGDFLSSLV
ncbi:hypothetical protein Tco_0594331, partial [Tanacetum coccineum]